MSCTAYDYGSQQEGEVIVKKFEVPVVNGKSVTETAGVFKATVRIYDPIGDNHQRIVLDIRTTDIAGKIHYASTFVDDAIPHNLAVTVSHGEGPSGSLQCRSK